MLAPSGTLKSKSPLRELLETIDELMGQLAITLPNTGIGCYFFNSEITSSNCESGMFQYFKLQDLNTKIMKQLRDTLNDTDDRNGKPVTQLSEEIPMIQYDSPESFDDNRTCLNNVLVQMKKEFIFTARNNKRYNYKRVFLITDNDKPFDPSTSEGQSLKKNIRLLLDDLDNAKINVVPFFLNKQQSTFESSLYAELLFLNTPEGTNSPHGEEGDDALFAGKSIDPISIKDMRNRINSRKEVHRVQFQCSLEIGPGLTIAIKGYTVLTTEYARRANYMYTKSETPKTVQSYTKYYTADGSKMIQDKRAELVKAYKFGDEVICLSDQQLATIQNFEQDLETSCPKLKIIGFREINKAFQHQYHIRNAPFVYVNTRGSYANSFRAFSCLYQSTRELERAAIVWGSVRKGSPGSLYALVPSNYSSINSISNSVFPQGFFMIQLPFRDNIRRFPSKAAAVQVPEQFTQIAKKLFNAFELKKGYTPMEYKNPTLQWHYKILRDEALLEEIQKEEEEGIAKKANAIIKFDDTLSKVSKIQMILNEERLKMQKMNIEDKNLKTLLTKQAKRLLLVRTLNSQLSIMDDIKGSYLSKRSKSH